MALRSANSTTKAGGSLAAVDRQPQGTALGIFTEEHGFLERVGGEVEDLKKEIAYNESLRRAELEDVRKALENEQLARRNALNELRYEFEEFVHKKIDKVIDEVEDIKRTEHSNDTNQQHDIDSLAEDVSRLKENLLGVQVAWNRLVSTVLCPPGNEGSRLQSSGGRAESAGRQPRA
mmetsp:Transcript_85489/g.227102  ORF Transcript_85489/g.227102 Transcript_85489/m.227102 type:complete len:177 (-) Transcript_85489:23-553(-)